MPKANLDHIGLSSIQAQPYTFESQIEGIPALTLYLAPLGSVGWDSFRVLKRELTARYVEGNWFDSDGNLRKEPDVFAVQNGVIPRPVVLNEDTIARAAKAEIMQTGPESEKYSALELIPWAFKAEDIWDQVQVKLIEVQASYQPGKCWPVPSEEQTPIS